MNTTEVRAHLLRRALGVVGPGSPRDIYQLCGFLGDAVELIDSPSAKTGEYRFLPDGRARIKLPILLDERRHSAIALHEHCHYLCEERQVGNTEDLLPLALELSEREADALADAFLLPPEVIAGIRCMSDAYDLAEEFGISLERIERRKLALKRAGPLVISSPPPWSAWHHYRVEFYRHPVISRFRLVPTTPYAVPLEIPVAPKMYVPTGKALHWDLLALRLHEFHHKHHAGARVQLEPAGWHFEELMPQRTRRKQNRRR